MQEKPEIEEARKLVKRVNFVTLTTLDETGGPDTRLLFNLRKMRAKAIAGDAALEDEFATWLGTNTSSRKVAQIRRDARVCLYYTDSLKFQGLSLKGRLEEVTDAAVKKALWTPSWEQYYPGGLLGGDYSVLRFIPESGRYYHGLATTDFTCTGKM